MSKLKYFVTSIKKIHRNRNISILAMVDDVSFLDKHSKIYRYAKISRSVIGKYTYIGPRTQVNHTVIGNFCSISWDCNIGLSSHTMSNLSTSPIFTDRKNGTGYSWTTEVSKEQAQSVEIGSDVWIGARAIVLSGVTIGDGAVIGAGAVVTKSVPPYAVAVGVPAKVIKSRFSDEIVSAIQKLKWWDWPDEVIKSKIELFKKSNPTLQEIEVLLESSGVSSNEQV